MQMRFNCVKGLCIWAILFTSACATTPDDSPSGSSDLGGYAILFGGALLMTAALDALAE